MTNDLAELSDREIRKEIRKAHAVWKHLDSLDPSVVIRGGEAQSTLDAMDRANSRIAAASKEMGVRSHQAWIDSAPQREAYRDFERGSQERKKRLKPLREAVAIAQTYFAHPELAGQHLDATRLTDEQARELRDLATARLAWSRSFGTDEELPPPSEEAESRYYELLGGLCGDTDLFPRARRERAIAERREAIADAERKARLPRGGDAVLPGIAFDWLTAPQGLTPAEVGALGVVVLGLANESSPFRDSHFADGEIIVPGGDPQMPGNHSLAESGHVRLKDALTVLAMNGFVEIERNGVGLKIRPGTLLRGGEEDGS